MPLMSRGSCSQNGLMRPKWLKGKKCANRPPGGDQNGSTPREWADEGVALRHRHLSRRPPRERKRRARTPRTVLESLRRAARDVFGIDAEVAPRDDEPEQQVAKRGGIASRNPCDRVSEGLDPRSESVRRDPSHCDAATRRESQRRHATADLGSHTPTGGSSPSLTRSHGLRLAMPPRLATVVRARSSRGAPRRRSRRRHAPRGRRSSEHGSRSSSATFVRAADALKRSTMSSATPPSAPLPEASSRF